MCVGFLYDVLQHLNTISPTIKFTVEQEKDGQLPFLDALEFRKEDGSLEIGVYRKFTHTDRYLPYIFYTPKTTPSTIATTTVVVPTTPTADSTFRHTSPTPTITSRRPRHPASSTSEIDQGVYDDFYLSAT